MLLTLELLLHLEQMSNFLNIKFQVLMNKFLTKTQRSLLILTKFTAIIQKSYTGTIVKTKQNKFI